MPRVKKVYYLDKAPSSSACICRFLLIRTLFAYPVVVLQENCPFLLFLGSFVQSKSIIVFYAVNWTSALHIAVCLWGWNWLLCGGAGT